MEQQEKILIKRKTSRKSLLVNYVIAIISLSIVVYSGGKLGNEAMRIFFLVFLLIAVFIIILSEIKIKQQRIKATDKKIIISHGIMNKNITTIKYSSINEVILIQPLLKRILGYGDLIIRTSGAQHHDVELHSIDNPEMIKGLIENSMVN